MTKIQTGLNDKEGNPIALGDMVTVDLSSLGLGEAEGQVSYDASLGQAIIVFDSMEIGGFLMEDTSLILSVWAERCVIRK